MNVLLRTSALIDNILVLPAEAGIQRLKSLDSGQKHAGMTLARDISGSRQIYHAQQHTVMTRKWDSNGTEGLFTNQLSQLIKINPSAPLLSHITSYQMRSNTDINALSSLLVAKKLEIPWVHNPDIVALTRHCERSEAISQISLNYSDLDAVFQRMRKMQEIATSLLRLAMTTKWDSSGCVPFIFMAHDADSHLHRPTHVSILWWPLPPTNRNQA